MYNFAQKCLYSKYYLYLCPKYYANKKEEMSTEDLQKRTTVNIQESALMAKIMGR